MFPFSKKDIVTLFLLYHIFLKNQLIFQKNVQFVERFFECADKLQRTFHPNYATIKKTMILQTRNQYGNSF